jgi:hypothetical protein
MAEMVSCPQCRRALNVRPELLGQLVQCPACGTTFTADAPNALPAPPAGPPEGVQQPPPRREERRRADFDFTEDDRDDRSRRGRRGSLDFEEHEGPLRPHRGALILTLGILGVLFSCCPLAGWIMGGIAMSMGNADLMDMARKKMDRSGWGITQAGKVLGTIAVVIATISFVLGLARQFVAIR